MGNVFGSLFLISTGGAIGIAAAAFVVALAAGRKCSTMRGQKARH